MGPVIIVFAKAPVPGRVKTRLAPTYSAGEAARLHHALTLDALETACATGVDVELHVDQPEAFPAEAIPPRIRLRAQAGGDLGARMLAAIRAALAEGRPRALLIGADVAALPSRHLPDLLEATTDVVLGPAEDGGFYAIGCRRCHPSMFDGVAWSQPSTLEQTRQAVTASGLSVSLGPAWFDVDLPADVARLRGMPELGANTRAWLAAAPIR